MTSSLSGRFEGHEHVFPLRVYYEDTDAIGIVYHANYLKFAERARTEVLRLCGIQQQRLSREQGLSFAISSCEMTFRRPARLDDLVEVRSRFLELGGAVLRLLQIVTREGEELARISVRIALLRSDGRPSRFPQALREALLPLCQSEDRIESHA